MISRIKGEILRSIPSNESNILRKYFSDYMALLQKKIVQYETDLKSQLLSYPKPLLSVQLLDERLAEFVRLHHHDLVRAVNYQIGQLNTTQVQLPIPVASILYFVSRIKA